MKRFALTCALTLASTIPVLAADNPWVGTWKLDPAKSHLTGDTFTYSKLSNGMMRYDDGPNKRDFGIDGKEYPTSVKGGTTAWTAAGDNAWDSIARFKGVVTFKAHRTLSADGKTYTIHGTNILPDGKTTTSESVYTRVTGTSGLVGTWRSTKYEDSAPDTYTVSARLGGVLHWDIPAYQQTMEGKPDGTDLVITGPLVTPDFTVSYKIVSPKSMSYITKKDGKPFYYGVDTLAADGKSFTESSWSSGKESEKTTGFYVKQ